ncbi:LUD domain-containing protein [Georgenia sp. 10Sc9-8]|uniref:LUD domain-containing protein n=1 Tax=Georgenia halotolerans TaxID=3028317 RepID=A0ABT5TXV9_9MICO|nr:LUD domain-containing protein [Georgenia halotolerans]
MEARDAILARIHDALGRSGDASSRTSMTPGAPTGSTPARAYRTHTGVEPGSPQALDLFVERVEDYRARVHRCTEAELPAVLAGLLDDDGGVVVPPGLPTAWTDAVTGARVDDPPLSHAALDEVGAVLTAARVGIAETGTIVLDAQSDQGRRVISLIPDHHVCVVRAEQVVVTVPEAVAVLGEHPDRPQTWIAGPSATSDIELERIEGVHGPRVLDVVVVAASSSRRH